MKHLFYFLAGIMLFASCKDHGKKISEGYLEVYYKDGVTEAQAGKVFDYLYPRWEDQGEKTARKSVQLTRTGKAIDFRMVSKMDVMEELDESLFYTLGNELSGLLNDIPVNIVLTDNTFKEIKTYAFKKSATSDYGRKVSSGNIEVYVKPGMNMQTAKELADFLNDEMNPDNVISFQLTETREGYINVKMVSSEEKAKDITYDTIASFLDSMSGKVFDGEPFVMDFTDDRFRTIKSFEHKIPNN